MGRWIAIGLALCAALPLLAAESAAEREPGASAAEPSLDRALRPPTPDEARRQVEVRSHLRDDGTRITEYAIGGRVYMIRVEPKVGPAYVLYDRDGDGAFETRLPGRQRKIAPPMWVIRRF